MDRMQIVPVDERDSGWENSNPRFRVYLLGGGETTTHGSSDTYDITGADVLQVIDWAQRQAGDVLTYAVALVSDDDEEERRSPGGGRGLVWLLGMDGNDSAGTGHEADAQRRMLARRTAPVGVPEADRMPGEVPGPYNDETVDR